jgi:hypothetical protein
MENTEKPKDEQVDDNMNPSTDVDDDEEPEAEKSIQQGLLMMYTVMRSVATIRSGMLNVGEKTPQT